MKNQLKSLFQSQFDLEQYTRLILSGLLHSQQIKVRPELLEETSDGDVVYGLGIMEDANRLRIGLFYTDVRYGDVTRKRVGLRRIVEPYIKANVDAALAVFDDGKHWRLSFVTDLQGQSTSPKRFSYVMGDPQGQYRTPVERLMQLGGSIRQQILTLSAIRDAFSVEALSDAFFDEYHLHYDRIVAELARQGKVGAIHHDYVKKMMGRIVFLHFLQKKGWLNGNPSFLRDLFLTSPYQADFLEQVLEPLFFGIFNTESEQREKLFANEHWDKDLLKQWEHLPYLNGGLFERDEVDKMNIRLPASLFNNLFTFLASYNFTVDENDPDDAEIGVDPEMLGKIFESLLEDNKAKGAFYTPKEIVRYMCKESLIAYLSEQLSVNSEQNDKTRTPTNTDFQFTDHSSLITKIRTFVETHEFPSELEPYRDILDRALREVKICDPAIGSGAFPMGLLNELWRCREAISIPPAVETQCIASLQPTTRAALKREIIENNVYGVDIEKGAIDIARLRFWLSIVVDSDEPEALPNFDYKFMQGNSLIESFEGVDLSRMMSNDGQHSSLGKGRQKAGANQLGIEFASTDTKRNLQLMLREYFSITDHEQKSRQRSEINDSVKSYIRQQGLRPEAAARLTSLDPSANQEFFLWHTWFKDIFDKGGFDIVVGNPPYVVLAGDDYWNLQYKKIYATANDGKTNLYKLFFEHGLRMLRSNGVLSYITPNTYLTGKDCKVLRNLFFTNVSLHEIIEYTEKDKVFKNVTQAVTTMVLSKRVDKNNKVKIRTYKQGTATCKQSDLQKLDVIIPLDAVIQRMNQQKGRLSDFFKINQGEVNLSTKKDYYSEYRTSDTLPMWRGNNIGKFVPQSWPFEYCEKIVSNPDYYTKERIVMQEVSNQNQPFRTKAIISPKNYICGHSTNSLTPLNSNVPIKFYLGLINSRAFNYYCDYFSYTNHITVSGIKQTPIPQATTSQVQEMIELVDKILEIKCSDTSADTSALEREIDGLVYGLYGLTEEEVEVVEGKDE